MKILHLSDLHIGRKLGTISLKDDQEYILKTILKVIDDKQVETVMIAGDVYDKTIPSTEAITLFDDFLISLVKRNIKVLISSGNHDSAERLAFLNRLISTTGIHIASAYNGQIEKVTLQDEYGDINFFLLPFVKALHVAHYFKDEEIASSDYTKAIEVALKHTDIDTSQRNIILSHQFVTGSSKGGSEIASVGGLDNVDSYVYDVFDYTALGHIHRPQNVKGKNIRYCGTPMKYDFSEENQEKSLTIIDIKEKGNMTFEYIPINSLREFYTLTGSYKQIMSDQFNNYQNTNHFIHIILTDEQDVPNAFNNMLKLYPNLISMSYDNRRTRSTDIVDGGKVDLELKPIELVEDFYKAQNGGLEMDSNQKDYILKLLESIEEGNQ